MKRFFAFLLILWGGLYCVACAEDPAIPGLDIRLTSVMFMTSNNPGLAADVTATINHDDRTVLARMNGGSLTALTPSLFAVGAAGYDPQGAQDFTTPVYYTLLSKDGFSSLGYMITVLPGGDLYDCTLAKQFLAIGYAVGESDQAVTNNLTLPLTSTNGCTVAWSSSATNIVVNGTTGTVTRPPFKAGDLGVTLTATITKGTSSTTKDFPVRVIRRGVTDQECADLDVGAVAVGYTAPDTATSVTKNVTLPTAGTNGSTISWASDKPAVVSVGGVVTRPDFSPAGDAAVVLTATATKNTNTANRDINLTVKQKDDPAIAAVASAMTNLEVVFAANESASFVTNNVLLATTNTTYGVGIVWSRVSGTAVEINGAVTRPAFTAGNDTVVLRATLTKTTFAGAPTRTETKNFTLIVIKNVPNDAEAVGAAKAALAIAYQSGDSASFITKNVTLPLTDTLGYETTISWAQTVGTAIAADGTVTRPAYSGANATVTLTATISRSKDSSATDTKVFENLVVIKLPPTSDDEKVAADKDNLAVGYAAGDSATSVTKNLTLAIAGTNAGVTIAWASDKADVVSTAGVVTRPAKGEADVEVKLTATISCGGAIDQTKEFTLTVKAIPSMTLLFANADFEVDAALTTGSGTALTYSTTEYFQGARSLRVVAAALTGNGTLFKTSANCDGKQSYTKVVFWLKGSSTSAGLSVRMVTANTYWNIGAATGSPYVSSSSAGYGTTFNLATWTKVELTLPATGDTSGYVFELRGGKTGSYDFYIDGISFE